MGYCHKYKINGFNIGIGDILWGQGILISLEDEEISEALKNKDTNLIEALHTAHYHSKELQAINFFKDGYDGGYFFKDNFNWEQYFNGYHSNENIIENKLKATTVLCGNLADENIRQRARRYLNACDGDYPAYIPTDDDIKALKLRRYARKRHVWSALLSDSKGYKCAICGETEEKLTIKHLVTIQQGGETELENLEFRCLNHRNTKK